MKFTTFCQETCAKIQAEAEDMYTWNREDMKQQQGQVFWTKRKPWGFNILLIMGFR